MEPGSQGNLPPIPREWYLALYGDEVPNGDVRTFEQDIRIWANELYRERPLLCEADGPIHEFRSWVRQFHSAR